MAWELREETMAALARHIEVRSTFESDRVFDVRWRSGEWQLEERQRATPFHKDYDVAESPLEWLRFDTTHWVLVGAFDGPTRLGGAIGAFDSPGVDMLEGRRDLAVVWDLRVAPAARRAGVASALLGRVEQWARRRGCVELKVETQATNFAACNLYRRRGFWLADAVRGAYDQYPDEAQLIWRKSLA